MLPELQSSDIENLFPPIEMGVDTDFYQKEASFYLLERINELIHEIGYDNVIVFFDKLDEDYRLNNDSDDVAIFIKPLLTDTKLLLASWIQLVIFVWEIPFNKLISNIRTQKLTCISIQWETADLIRALNSRLKHFSENRITDYNMLFDEATKNNIISLLNLSNHNPRDLWHILNRVFEEQYKTDNSVDKITIQALHAGSNSFVKKFNFYEYYPRRSNARSNTMDVYAYIKHLLTLPEDEFTKNMLNIYAKVGSSVHNYVVGMEGLGLIKPTEKRVQNGVVYKINDPKVVYAIKNKLEIRKP